MARFHLTAEQREAIDSLDQDCIVTAGAGSGKTRVLVERFLSILERHLDEPDPLDNVVAITFTEKAATEMKERVRNGAAERMEQAQQDGRIKESEGWYRMVSGMDRARISTIHSFCARLLRDFPVEANVDPDFRILDDPQSDRLLNEAVHRVLPAVVPTGRTNGELPSPLERVVTLWGVQGSIHRLTLLYREMTTYGWEPADLDLRTRKHLQETGRRLIRKEAELLRQVVDAGDKILSLSGGKRCTRFQEEWPRLKEALEEARNAADRIGPLTEVKKLTGGNWGRKEEILQPRDRLKSLCEECLAAAGGNAWLPEEKIVLQELLTAVEEIHRGYLCLKAEAGGLDFDELQVRAVRLLRDHPAVVRRVRERVRYLMVDEYQDTNEAQKMLTDLLCPGPHGEHVPGKLFVVGDPKQSIYRFRGADVSVFRRTREEILAEGGKEVSLLDNFRSEGSLVNFVNVLFSGLMSNDPRDDNHYRAAGANRQAEGDTRVEMLTLPPSAEEGKGEHRELETAAIARRIRQLVDEGIPPGDVAVLFQAMTHVKILEEALIAQGVPCYVVKGSGFFERQEITDVLHLLRLLADPSDRLALTGLLRSPFCAVSDETLLRICSKQGWERELSAWAETEGLAPEEQEKLLRFAAYLSRWRYLQGRITVAELLERALEESAYRHVVWALPQGEQARANLDKFLRLTRTWQTDAPYSVHTVLQNVNLLIQRQARETEAAVEAEEGNSVKLMTIHQAKGLEFPVVIVPDLSRRPPREMPDLRVDRESGLVIRLADLRLDRVETYRWREVKEKEERFDREESVRHFYVAITRAEDRIILSGLPQKHRGVEKGEGILSADTWSKWLDALLGYDRIDWEKGTWGFPNEGPCIQVEAFSEAEVTEEDVVPSLLDQGWLEKPVDEGGSSLPSLTIAAPRGWTEADNQEVSVTDLTLLSNCPRKFYYTYHLGLSPLEEEKVLPTEAVGKQGEETGAYRLDPRMKGQIVHKLLEVIPSVPPAPEELDLLCREALDQWGVAASQRQKALAELLPMVETYLSSRFYRELPRLTGLKQEARFIGRTQGLEIEGIIDRLHCTSEGEWELIDYKTNDVDANSVASMAAEYLPQLRLYALAAQEEWGIRVDRAILYFLKPDQVVSHEVTSEWLREAEATLDELACLLKQGSTIEDFFPRPGKRCGYCGYRRICEAGFRV
ncbi:UvrD-helicase domain-containing protein [Salinithrix halophila]|uniref:DNA 3'-5' helicase n=1 Tax=Salinithrix halophila TaxID=1485204 RepID=A0ABV8JD82_9BACL